MKLNTIIPTQIIRIGEIVQVDSFPFHVFTVSAVKYDSYTNKLLCADEGLTQWFPQENLNILELPEG